MEFRPCIDIHNGKVKQIVGSSLEDATGSAKENFVSSRDADFFAEFYKKEGLNGGHAIILNKIGTLEYEQSKEQAMKALRAFPRGLQIGGGITDANIREFIDAGASHGIVTSFVFCDGQIHEINLKKLRSAVGKQHVVLDLSARKKGDHYYVVTDRWQKFTKEEVTPTLLENLSEYCDEFLIHAADVEGQKAGVDEELLKILAGYKGLPVTYAGGVGSYEDIDKVKSAGEGRIHLTIGSALDLFGGPLNYETVMLMMDRR
jgi:phosphoribosylformimino-5-aminoimidazole carboxamide ribotide isomerase